MLRRKSIAAAASLVLFGGVLNHNAPGSIFQPGEFITYSQDDWGTLGTTAAQLLVNHFDFLYPNGIEVGIHGAAGSSALVTSPDAVFAYLPSSGPPGPLDNDYVDPTSTSAGVFGSWTLALKLDVDFTDAGFISGSAGIPFGDLVLHDMIVDFGGAFSVDMTAFNGSTVRQYLADMNVRLGGGGGPYTYDDVAALTDLVTRAFQDGTPSQFAEDHLRIASDPAAVPEATSLLVWGTLAVLTVSWLVYHRRRHP